MTIPTRLATDADVLNPDFPDERPSKVSVSGFYELREFVTCDHLRPKKYRGVWVVQRFCDLRLLRVRTDHTGPLPDFVVNLSESARTKGTTP